jgi:WD40 repeat protein
MILGGEFARPEFVRRFRQEAEAAARLQHPNIVAIHEIGEHEGQAYFTMDFVDGPNLAELVRSGPLRTHQAALYLERIAQGVAFAHRHGILHRDLKPSNILVDPFDQPRITDFGLARELSKEADLTLTGQALGSPGYVSPEQAAGRPNTAGAAADIYSLGAVLYFLLTGRAPFQAATLPGVLLQVQQTEPVAPRRLNPSIPADLETICLKCLEKDPKRRYATAEELATEVNRFLRHEPIQAHPVSSLEKVWRWRGRNRALAGALAALALALVLGIAGVAIEWRRAEHLAIAERHQRTRVEQSERQTRLNLYAADMAEASRAIERGDLGSSRRLLESHRPAPNVEDLRGFEWHYLWRQSRGDQLGVLHGHAWIVNCAAFSPDGHLLATGGQDSTVNLWEPAPQRLVTALPAHTGAVWSVSFTPDGTVLATAGSDHKVRLWDLQTKQMLASFDGAQVALTRRGSLMAISESSLLFWEPAGNVSLWDWQTHQKILDLAEPGKSAAFSSDGRLLAVANREQGIRIWETPSGALRQFLSSPEQVWSPCFSPDGRRLAAAARSGVFLWDLARDADPVLLPHPLRAWSVEFSPDGRTLLSAASDRGVRLWDVITDKLLRVFWGHADEVWCARFSPDARILASAGKDADVLLWSATLRPELEPFPHTRWERPLFSPDGTQLITTLIEDGQPSTLWRLADRSIQVVLTNGPAVGFSPDGHCLLRPSRLAPALEWWAITNLAMVKTLPLEGVPPSAWPFQTIRFSEDWRTGFGISGDGRIWLFDASSGHLLALLKGPTPPIRSAALSRGARCLAVSTERENSAYLFSLPGGRLTKLDGHRDFVSGMSFSPDGRLLATGSVDAKIKLWNTDTGREITTLTGHAEEATDVDFSPDGRTLASIGARDCIKLWHVATGREMVSLANARAGFDLQFSPDGRRLAICLSGSGQNEAVQLVEGLER